MKNKLLKTEIEQAIKNLSEQGFATTPNLINKIRAAAKKYIFSKFIPIVDRELERTTYLLAGILHYNENKSKFKGVKNLTREIKREKIRGERAIDKVAKLEKKLTDIGKTAIKKRDDGDFQKLKLALTKIKKAQAIEQDTINYLTNNFSHKPALEKIERPDDLLIKQMDIFDKETNIDWIKLTREASSLLEEVYKPNKKSIEKEHFFIEEYEGKSDNDIFEIFTHKFPDNLFEKITKNTKEIINREIERVKELTEEDGGLIRVGPGSEPYEPKELTDKKSKYNLLRNLRKVMENKINKASLFNIIKEYDSRLSEILSSYDKMLKNDVIKEYIEGGVSPTIVEIIPYTKKILSSFSDSTQITKARRRPSKKKIDLLKKIFEEEIEVIEEKGIDKTFDETFKTTFERVSKMIEKESRKIEEKKKEMQLGPFSSTKQPVKIFSEKEKEKIEKMYKRTLNELLYIGVDDVREKNQEIINAVTANKDLFDKNVDDYTKNVIENSLDIVKKHPQHFKYATLKLLESWEGRHYDIRDKLNSLGSKTVQKLEHLARLADANPGTELSSSVEKIIGYIINPDIFPDTRSKLSRTVNKILFYMIREDRLPLEKFPPQTFNIEKTRELINNLYDEFVKEKIPKPILPTKDVLEKIEKHMKDRTPITTEYDYIKKDENSIIKQITGLLEKIAEDIGIIQKGNLCLDKNIIMDKGKIENMLLRPFDISLIRKKEEILDDISMKKAEKAESLVYGLVVELTNALFANIDKILLETKEYYEKLDKYSKRMKTVAEKQKEKINRNREEIKEALGMFVEKLNQIPIPKEYTKEISKVFKEKYPHIVRAIKIIKKTGNTEKAIEEMEKFVLNNDIDDTYEPVIKAPVVDYGFDTPLFSNFRRYREAPPLFDKNNITPDKKYINFLYTLYRKAKKEAEKSGDKKLKKIINFVEAMLEREANFPS